MLPHDAPEEQSSNNNQHGEKQANYDGDLFSQSRIVAGTVESLAHSRLGDITASRI
jgi:hypothetical protein